MEKSKLDNRPSDDTLIQQAKDFVANKQYNELLNWVNGLLETGEKDLYYRMRAIARVYRPYTDADVLSDLLAALDDVEQALRLNYSETNLNLKHWVLVSSYKVYDQFFPINEYSIDHVHDELAWRDSKYDDRVCNLNHPFVPLITDCMENYNARIHVLDELIELTKKPQYYENRARDHSTIAKKQLIALEDINKSIALEPTAQRYMLKVDIEIAMNRIDEALQSVDLAYKYGISQAEHLGKKLSIFQGVKKYDDALVVLNDLLRIDEHSIKHLDDKFLMLYDLNRYKESLKVLDDMIALHPPKSVNGFDIFVEKTEHSYARKLDVLLRLEDYDGYASLIKSFLYQKLSISLIYYLSILIAKQQYCILLKHFEEEQDNNQVIKWFVVCALIGLDDKVKASNLIRVVNYDCVYNETSDYHNIWDRSDIFQSRQVHREDSLALLCESLNLRKMSFLLFLELIQGLRIESHYKTSPNKGSNVLHNAADETVNVDCTYLSPNAVISADLEVSQTSSWHYDGDLFDLSDVRTILSEMKSELDNKSGIARLTTELLAKQKLLKWIKKDWLTIPTGVGELLLGIERELNKIINEMNSLRINEAKLEERNRILSNLSHSIKNMLRSIIDPLLNLKEELPGKANIIDNALKGANLIREMVNSINLSYKSNLDDLLWDIKHPGDESVALQDMILHSLQYSIGNMFDFRYFPAYAANFFPRSLKKQDYEKVKEDWKTVSTATSLSDLQRFADKNTFKLSVNLTDSAQYHIGNEKSSAIKLLILFQEIIFNAVKYVSYVQRTERFIDIDLSEYDDKLKLQISNSYRPEVQAKTTGVGKLVIENFAKVLDCTPIITRDNNVYSITLEFSNIWRKNA